MYSNLNLLKSIASILAEKIEGLPPVVFFETKDKKDCHKYVKLSLEKTNDVCYTAEYRKLFCNLIVESINIDPFDANNMIERIKDVLREHYMFDLISGNQKVGSITLTQLSNNINASQSNINVACYHVVVLPDKLYHDMLNL